MDFTRKFDQRESAYSISATEIKKILGDLSINDAENIQLLEGGYRNINLKITTSKGQLFMLRISNNSPLQFEKEISILNALNNHVPVPNVYGYIISHSSFKRHVTLLDFLPGKPLSIVEDHLDTEEIQTVAEQLGTILATIHRFTFKKSGFLGQDFNVIEPFLTFSAGYYGHLKECLKSEFLSQRISPTAFADLTKFISVNHAPIEHLSEVTSLVHSDFNQKNILVDKQNGMWTVTGILDWEFAFSGSPLVDFGNFFRFENEMPDYRAALIAAYQEHGGRLKANWRHVAKVLDLLSMVQFLTREGKYPKTFTTASNIINSTLYDS